VGVGDGAIAVRVAGAAGGGIELGRGRLSVKAHASRKMLPTSAQMIFRGLMAETITQARGSVNASGLRSRAWDGSGFRDRIEAGNALTVLRLHVKLLALYCDGALR